MSFVAPGLSREVELRRLRTLYQLLSSLTRAQSLEDVYESALTSLLASTSADRAAILTFDDEGIMRFRAWRGLSEEYRVAVTGHTPWPRGTQNAEPVVVNDVEESADLVRYRSLFAREDIRALAFVPLELELGVFGIFILHQRDVPGNPLRVPQFVAAPRVRFSLERRRTGRRASD